MEKSILNEINNKNISIEILSQLSVQTLKSLLMICRHMVHNYLGKEKIVATIYTLLSSSNVEYSFNSIEGYYKYNYNINIDDINNIIFPVQNDDFFIPKKLCTEKKGRWSEYGPNTYNQLIINDFLFSNLFDPEKITINMELKKIKNIEINIKNKLYNFNSITKISSGAYGSVFKIRDKINKITLALKLEKPFNEKDNPKEKEIIDILNNSNCNTIKSRFIKTQSVQIETEPKVVFYPYSFYIMNMARGDLSNLKNILSTPYPNLFLQICEEVRKQIVLIYNHNNKFIYSDMKLENILFDCPSKFDLNKIKILIGDLGSAVSKNNKYVFTYPPWEHRKNPWTTLTTQTEIDNALSWNIGILLLSFITNPKEFNYKNLKSISDENYNKNINLIKKHYGKKYRLYLSKESLKRPSIFNSILN